MWYRTISRWALGISVMGLLGNALAASLPSAPAAMSIQPVQSIAFHNGDTITLPLSRHEVNRFTLENDTIAGMVCPPDRCRATLSPSDPTQSAYLTLTSTVVKPFTVHVSTLDKRYFSLQVTPSDVPGKIIQFVPQSPGQPVTQPLAQSWVATITRLMRAMIRHQPPDGYGIEVSKKKITKRLVNGLTAIPQLRYRGEEFTVTQYQLINPTSRLILLREPEFYHVGVVAVTLSQSQLRPHHQAVLYQVTTTQGR